MLSIASARGHAPLGKQQKRFNTLVKTAAQLREALRAWEAAQPDIARRAAAHDQLLAEHRAQRKALAILFDRHASSEDFSRQERRELAELAADLARELLEAMPEGTTDAKLKSIYNRHTGGNFDRERAHAEAAESRAMQDVLEQHGFDFGGEQFDSLEELEAAARAQRSTEASQGGTQRTSSRKKSARQEAAERKRETEASQVSRALQDVYRKLAHALHPDRERDPVERARKTQLMADVNVAYERRDLLALLELQLQFEQIDHAHIAGLAEDRLAHFNKLLAEQVAQLKQELAAIEHPYRVHLDVPPPRKLPPAYVIACLRDDIETLTDDLEHVQQDVRTLRAEIEVKMWLRARRDDARRTNDALEAFLELSLMVKGGTRRRRRRT